MATNFNDIAARLWNAADKLRANTHLRASEYYIYILDLIFLKFADQKYHQIDPELRSTLDPDKEHKIDSSSYRDHGAIYLPPESRFDFLLELSWAIGDAIDRAIRVIKQFNPGLQDSLPTDSFSQLDDRTLASLLRIIASIPFEADADIEGIYGYISEYCLDKIALREGSKGGDFFTPASISRLLVEIIQPYGGSIFDPACGVGGMFVQSAQFGQEQYPDQSTKISIFGQENTTEVVRLCKMNLFMHGLSGDIQRANSYYDYSNESVGHFDFIISNPPFNVSGVDKERLRDQRNRFPFGIPRADNANYLWIQMFYSALNQEGRAGFIMPNSAGDARFSEMEIRRRLIEEHVVDVIVSIGSNFLYPFTLPCTLWFLDKRKRNTQRNNQVLFIDARHIYNQLDRSHRNFTPDQLEFLANIVRLYRRERPKMSKGSRLHLEEVFPDAIYTDVSSLCRVATIDEIADQNWSLNPARYIKATGYAVSTVLPKRTGVFISYSHKDKRVLEQLRVHLSPLERHYSIEIWDDTKITSGALWREEIKKAIKRTRVAILLISANFLASQFIEEDELPPLLEAAHKEGAIILPIILSPCMFEDTQLGIFQAVNSEPMTGMNRHKKELVFLRVAETVRDNMISHNKEGKQKS